MSGKPWEMLFMTEPLPPASAIEVEKPENCPVCGGPWDEGRDTPHAVLCWLGEGACRQLGLYVLPAGFRLSVVVPIFNERGTLAKLLSACGRSRFRQS